MDPSWEWYHSYFILLLDLLPSTRRLSMCRRVTVTGHMKKRPAWWSLRIRQCHDVMSMSNPVPASGIGIRAHNIAKLGSGRFTRCIPCGLKNVSHQNERFVPKMLKFVIWGWMLKPMIFDEHPSPCFVINTIGIKVLIPSRQPPSEKPETGGRDLPIQSADFHG